MMQSKEKISKVNAMDIIRRFAKEYKKHLGRHRRKCYSDLAKEKPGTNTLDTQLVDMAAPGSRLNQYLSRMP